MIYIGFILSLIGSILIGESTPMEQKTLKWFLCIFCGVTLISISITLILVEGAYSKP
jgi:ABC-type uncharacterized transport system permease subunit